MNNKYRNAELKGDVKARKQLTFFFFVFIECKNTLKKIKSNIYIK